MERGELSDFEAWVAARTSLKSSTDIMKVSGASRATYFRRRKEDRFPIEMVMEICSRLALPIAQGLLAAGWVSEADLEWPGPEESIRALPDSALLEHLLHRAATREQDHHNDTGPSNSPSTPLAPVTGLHTDPLPYAATHNPEHCMDRVQDEGDI